MNGGQAALPHEGRTAFNDIETPSVLDEVLAETKRWELVKEQADAAFIGGIVPYCRSKEAARAIAMTGAELGFSPMTALRYLYFFDGKVTIASQAMLELAYRKVKGFNIRIIKSTEYGCALMASRHGRPEEPYSFSLNDAVRAELGYFVRDDAGEFILDKNGHPTFSSKKDNWRKYPREMNRARAIAAAVRSVAPEATMGLLAKEEAEDGVPFDSVAEVAQDAPSGAEGLKVALRTEAAQANGGAGAPTVASAVAPATPPATRPDRAAAPPGFSDFVPPVARPVAPPQPAQDAPKAETPKRGGRKSTTDVQTAQTPPAPAVPPPAPSVPATQTAVAPPASAPAETASADREPTVYESLVHDMQGFTTDEQFEKYRILVLESDGYARLTDEEKSAFSATFRKLRAAVGAK